SRKIVGWEVYAEESSAHAAETIQKTVLRESKRGVSPKIVLHSDNGAPMKGATMLGTLQMLGIRPSFGRPSVSNDNAYSESLFKTLKYRPDYPVANPFDTLEEARKWVSSFTGWYNEEHRHSAIQFVTPSQRHRGEDPGDSGSKGPDLPGSTKAKSPTMVRKNTKLDTHRESDLEPSSKDS
ncbi:transposase, partial [mine drainage metagenome]